MRRVVLRRLVDGTDKATIGEFRDGDQHVCFTLEEPWVDANKDGISDKSVSRIPAGVYKMKRTFSNRFKKTLFEIFGVPGRQACRVHSGNTTANTEGCILVGLSRGTLNGMPAVLQSVVALDKFHNHFPEDEVELEVTDAEGDSPEDVTGIPAKGA